MVRFVINQCLVPSVIVVFCLSGISSATKDESLTEQGRQTAFQQLLSSAGRLRLGASMSDVLPITTVEPPASGTTFFNDQESKKHDRRQAIESNGKEHHVKKKKDEKKENSKRQHHAGYGFKDYLI